MRGDEGSRAGTLDSENHGGELSDAPLFRLLSDEKIGRIHEASLQVLGSVGIKVTTEPARRLLADAGCSVSDGDIVRIPRGVVEDAIKSAPRRIVLYGREGNEALFLGGRHTYFGLGITGIYFREPESGLRRPARMSDIGLACRVGDALPNLDLVATPVVVRGGLDMPQDLVNQHTFAAMVSNTTKPLSILVENATALGDVLDMAEAVVGGPEAFRQRPFVFPSVSVVSPLVFNADTLERLLLSVDRGVPFRCGSSPMTGGTAPVTLAGELVICVAEFLGCLVISQLRRPGAPIVIGSGPAMLDMKTGNITYSAPEATLLTMAVAEMGHYYGLPVRNLAAFCSAMDADQQAALELTMGIYSCVLAGSNLVPYIGGLEAGINFSLEAAVMGDEIIGMVRRIVRGIPVDDESLALETIRAVGPGGNFLETEHTFRHYRREQWQPTLLCRTTYDSWAEGGGKLMGERVKEKLGEIIRSHQPKPLPDDVTSEMARIIDRRARSLA